MVSDLSDSTEREIRKEVAVLQVIYLFSAREKDIVVEEFECDDDLDRIDESIRLEVESRFYEWIRAYRHHLLAITPRARGR